MIGLLQVVAAMPAETPLFAARSAPVTAGQIRGTAAGVAARLDGGNHLYLYTASAALFVAGLLAAARRGLTVCCPAHVQPNYLREIGADGGVLLTDQDIGITSAVPMVLASAEEADMNVGHIDDLDLVFYTSGVTGAPKQIRKKISQIDREAWALDLLWGKQAGRTYATISHQHIYGMLFRVFWPVLSGRLSEDRQAEYWESLAGKLVAGTILISSPAHLTRLPPSPILAGASPDLVFSSGALLPFAAAQAARDRLGSLPIEVLGSTETGGVAWRRQDHDDALWTPFRDVRIDTAQDGALSVISPFANDERPVATGDKVERVGEKFRLKGRTDRVVKIDGKRVSLPRVEEALRTHPMVEDAAAVDLPLRKGGLGAIVELNDRGRKALAEQGAFRLSRHLRISLAARYESSERPKHWVFGSIPLDRQGKRVQAALRALFAQPADVALGNGAVAVLEAESAEILVELPPDLVWFKGHFPGQPVLPGIAQVHLAALWAERLWNWKPLGGNLSQLKFRQIIRPNDKVRLKLMRDMTKQRLKFAYHLESVVASEGTIGGGE